MQAEVVICGAGIAGVAVAYELAVKRGMRGIVLVDERAPLTLTSDKSTEAYRNWWPGPDDAMIRLMNRSIDLLDELADATDNRFLLNRRGYVYATARPEHVTAMRKSAENASHIGAGPLRVHEHPDSDYITHSAEEYRNQPDGADLLLDPDLIQTHFPYLTDKTVALLHARRCGWFSGQQLGMTMLEAAQEHGIRFISGRVTEIDTGDGQVRSVQLADGTSIATSVFVNCAGPFVPEVSRLLGVELPLYSERHVKVSFPDHLQIIPRDAPLVIWEDAQYLPWSDEEQEWFADSAEDRWLLDQFPPAAHFRPEGGGNSQNILLLWPFHTEPVEPTFPLPVDPLYPELTLRGMATFVPKLSAYFEALPKPWIDGGYYTRTKENRPIIGPLPVKGAFILGALSGFGLMAATGSAELLADHITGAPLPDHAAKFTLSRYDDPAYLAMLADWGSDGQL
jgi:glycine/D-amino acid oxidase-like deaminating enzyme